MDHEKIRQNDAERDRLLRLNSWADRIRPPGISTKCKPSKEVMFWVNKLADCFESSGGVWNTECQQAWDEMHE